MVGIIVSQIIKIQTTCPKLDSALVLSGLPGTCFPALESQTEDLVPYPYHRNRKAACKLPTRHAVMASIKQDQKSSDVSWENPKAAKAEMAEREH